MQAQFISAAPHFAEKYVVVEMRKLRGKVAKLLTARSLYYFLLCHNGD